MPMPWLFMELRGTPGSSRQKAALTVAAVILSFLTAAAPRASGVDAASHRRTLQGVVSLQQETPQVRLSHFRGTVEEVEEEDRRSRSSQVEALQTFLGPREDAHKKHLRRTKSLHPLRKFPGLDTSNAYVIKFAEAVDEFLAPWKGIEGLKAGLGNGRGMVSGHILRKMSQTPSFMSCCGHIIIKQGKVYFRYGGFLHAWYRVRRFVLTLKTIEWAISKYKLQHLDAELFLNTCDQPKSFDSANANARGGYPIFSTQWYTTAVDILYPDPLDMSKTYMTRSERQVPWEDRASKAVFRGSTTNFDLHADSNWRASPRIKLHMMTDVRPDLLDARVTRWSHVDREAIPKIQEDGIQLGNHLDRSDLDRYKYEVVADGGSGSSRTCGTLISGRVMIKQDSMYCQFFYPLLKPYINYIPTKRYFEDVMEQLEWAQSHDTEVQHMLRRAHEVADHACTWHGRALFWAVLLAKYSTEAMENSTAVVAPDGQQPCNVPLEPRMMEEWKNVEDKNSRVAQGWPPTCDEHENVKQPTCVFFCVKGSLRKLPQIWNTMEALAHIQLS